MKMTILVVACLVSAAPVSAQRVGPEFAGSRIQFHQNSRKANLLAPMFTPDYRWEGLAIGAAIVGVLGVVVGDGLCHLSDSAHPHCLGAAVGLGLVGAMAGGVTGGLIGGAIPKAPPDSTH